MQVNRTIDSERYQRPDSAFNVDLIELKADDGRDIGYIKLGHITPENFKKKFPTVIHWLGRSKGWCGVDEMYDNENWKGLVIQLNCHDRRIQIPDYFKTNYYKDVTDQEWKDCAEKALPLVSQKFENLYKNFKEYFVGKCYVDFAFVEEEFRSQGYYVELYNQAKKWCDERDLLFYTSSNKSDLAQRSFDMHVATGRFEIVKDKFNQFHGKANSFKRIRITNVNHSPNINTYGCAI